MNDENTPYSNPILRDERAKLVDGPLYKKSLDTVTNTTAQSGLSRSMEQLQSEISTVHALLGRLEDVLRPILLPDEVKAVDPNGDHFVSHGSEVQDFIWTRTGETNAATLRINQLIDRIDL